MDAQALRYALGQRLAVGFDGHAIPDEYRQMIREYKIGNAILFKRNVGSEEQLRELCTELRQLIMAETGQEPFIMIDEECGSVSRLAHIGIPTPCAMAIGATGDPGNARIISNMIGEELRSLGINFDLAPVLDCFTNPDNTVCGNRCFAIDPDDVSRFGEAYIHGLQDAGIIACGKHFPGHGDTAVDSHLALPTVNKPMAEIERTELVPFRRAIRAGVDAIMSAHVIFPAVEGDRPATVSRMVLTGLLRQKLGFDGLIISDGMEMKAVLDLYGIPAGTLMALCAGVDIALVCHSAEDAIRTVRHLEKAWAEGTLTESNITEHHERILRYKSGIASRIAQYAFAPEQQKSEAQRIMDASITLLNAPAGAEWPGIDAGTVVLGTPGRRNSLVNDENAFNAPKAFAKAMGAAYTEKAEAVKAETAVIFLDGRPDEQQYTDAVLKMSEQGSKIIAVSMFTPRCLDALPDSAWKIGAWQYDELALNSLIRWFRKR